MNGLNIEILKCKAFNGDQQNNKNWKKAKDGQNEQPLIKIVQKPGKKMSENQCEGNAKWEAREKNE